MFYFIFIYLYFCFLRKKSSPPITLSAMNDIRIWTKRNQQLYEWGNSQFILMGNGKRQKKYRRTIAAVYWVTHDFFFDWLASKKIPNEFNSVNVSALLLILTKEVADVQQSLVRMSLLPMGHQSASQSFKENSKQIRKNKNKVNLKLNFASATPSYSYFPMINFLLFSKATVQLGSVLLEIWLLNGHISNTWSVGLGVRSVLWGRHTYTVSLHRSFF